MEAALWSFSSYVVVGLATVAGGAIKAVPEYFWSNCVQLTSRVKARFFTGVQTRLPPITAMLKSGLQSPLRASCVRAVPPTPPTPQIAVLAREPYCNAP